MLSLDEINALLQLANRGPLTLAERLWVEALAAKISAQLKEQQEQPSEPVGR